MTPKLTRDILWCAAYDMRNPDPKQNRGINGVEMHWILKGPRGAIVWRVLTNWQLPEVEKEQDADPAFPRFLCHPIPAVVSYHSYMPQREGQKPQEGCSILGSPCYCDGNALDAEPIFEILVREGGDACWKELEQRYHHEFSSRQEVTH